MFHVYILPRILQWLLRSYIIKPKVFKIVYNVLCDMPLSFLSNLISHLNIHYTLLSLHTSLIAVPQTL